MKNKLMYVFNLVDAIDMNFFLVIVEKNYVAIIQLANLLWETVET